VGIRLLFVLGEEARHGNESRDVDPVWLCQPVGRASHLYALLRRRIAPASLRSVLGHHIKLSLYVAFS
jgi:hypothetical protein